MKYPYENERIISIQHVQWLVNDIFNLTYNHHGTLITTENNNKYIIHAFPTKTVITDANQLKSKWVIGHQINVNNNISLVDILNNKNLISKNPFKFIKKGLCSGYSNSVEKFIIGSNNNNQTDNIQIDNIQIDNNQIDNNQIDNTKTTDEQYNRVKTLLLLKKNLKI